MRAKEIFNILRCCPHLRVVTKVYKGLEWIHNDEGVVGFLAKVNSNLGKDVKLEKIRLYCKKANLPVEIIDKPESLTEFKIVIIK